MFRQGGGDAFAPFDIALIQGKLYVSYAVQDPTKHDDVAGPGNGIIDVFDTNGNFQQRLVTHGALNSPWGMAIAPADFGRFKGCLLVGNFGDGRINAYCKDEEGEWGYGGRLRSNNHDLVIDGLWGIGFGNGGGSGPTHTLYFAAGPDDETHGLFGSIAAP